MSGGPNGLADVCRAKLDNIAAELVACTDMRQRRALNKHAAMVRRMLRFCVTRAGYVK